MTELLRVEEGLEDSEKRLRLATGAAALGAFEWDLQTATVVWENARMFEILGRAMEDGPVETMAFLEQVHPADIERLQEAMVTATEPGGNIGRHTPGSPLR